VSQRRIEGERLDRPGGIVQWAYAGADVLFRPKAGSGVVTVLLQLPGLPSQETERTAGISWLLARAALRGAGGMGVEELAQASELLGGSVSPQVGPESLGWGITVRPDGLGRAAEILRALALEPELDADGVRLERELQASDARRVRDDMFRYPLQRVLGQAFPDDPYGRATLGEPETLLGLTNDDVREWAAHLPDTRPVVVVTGDIAEEDALTALVPLTQRQWREHGSGVTQAPPAWQAGRGDEARRKEQTALAMAFPCAAFGSADRFPLRVASAVLSGLAGRLFLELRDQRSLAYTVAAFPWLARRAGAVLCYIATSPAREEEAREAMLAELARASAEPPTPEELERARNYAAGSVETRQQSGRAVAAEILEAFIHGDLDAVAETPARLRAVTQDEVVRVTEAAFDPASRAEYVVRGSV
jgi:zinc protease